MHQALWPDRKVRFYDKQEEIVLSTRDHRETHVTAGHDLGKDFVTGFIALGMFICPDAWWPEECTRIRKEEKREPTVRIVTTSVKDDHLRVLWGEITRWVDTCQIPLSHKKGGGFSVNHRDIRRTSEGIDGYCYLRGMVSKSGEGMAGHHADCSALVIDEASGVSDLVYERGVTWAKKVLVIGNPYPSSIGCSFFEKHVMGGCIQ